jgi:hypothetical protein
VSNFLVSIFFFTSFRHHLPRSPSARQL